ncbi:MAG: glutamate--tRNA ligase [Minisyncoccia bacterium]
MDDPKISQQLFAPRVRIAPSPTGWFHFGTARTALFNYLFARKNGGKFIVRIEDTDKTRSEKRFEEDILNGLKWLGLYWDEGPDKEGDYGPYRQSERLEIYTKYLKQLLDEGKAYYCFCTPEELKAQKEDMIAQGLIPKYSGKCRNLTKEQIEQNFREGKNAVIRLKMPNTKLKFTDLIRGEVEFDLDLIGDIVIAKSLKEPLYNFSVVVDDYLMNITHVIRGEDHVPNTPKQIVIQEALGFPRPIYAHLPMILGPDRSKFSKRHGATALVEYKKLGYLPEAIVNFLALLGWHPRNDKEIMPLEEIIQEFDLKRVQKSGAIFNVNKLNWFNHQYLKILPKEKIYQYFEEFLKENKPNWDYLNNNPNYFKKILDLEITRINHFSDIFEFSDYLLKKEIDYPSELLIWKGENNLSIKKSLEDALNLIQSISENDLNQINLQSKFNKLIDSDPSYQNNRGKILWPLRVALSGKQASPGPFELAELLGKQETIKRITRAIKKLS